MWTKIYLVSYRKLRSPLKSLRHRVLIVIRGTVRLMRCVTIVGPFAERGPEEYSHTAYSKMYLVPEIKGLFKLMCVLTRESYTVRRRPHNAELTLL